MFVIEDPLDLVVVAKRPMDAWEFDGLLGKEFGEVGHALVVDVGRQAQCDVKLVHDGIHQQMVA